MCTTLSLVRIKGHLGVIPKRRLDVNAALLVRDAAVPGHSYLDANEKSERARSI